MKLQPDRLVEVRAAVQDSIDGGARIKVAEAGAGKGFAVCGVHGLKSPGNKRLD